MNGGSGVGCEGVGEWVDDCLKWLDGVCLGDSWGSRVGAVVCYLYCACSLVPKAE